MSIRCSLPALSLLSLALALGGCSSMRALVHSTPEPRDDVATASDTAAATEAPTPPPEDTTPTYTADSLAMGPAEPTPLERLQADVSLRALQLLGTRYRYGGGDPKTGFDCSGFVRYVFRDLLSGDLPRASAAMASLPVPSVDKASLRAGDLLFFKIRRGRVSHVAIYLGGGRFVHAPRGGGRVRVEQLDDRYWRARFAGAKRVLGETLPTAPPRERAP
jgi:cell wall-associated NlpC family hydrolase